MSTVGEMVEVEMALDFANAVTGESVSVRSYLHILEELGIWNAEVLECVAGVRDLSGLRIRLRPGTDHEEQILSFRHKRPLRSLGVKSGDRVRVIVLKEEDGE